MQRRAMGFEKVAITGDAVQLPPGATARVAVRTDIASPKPAAIGTVGIRAEMLRGVHLTWPSPAGGDRRRWEGRWQSRWFLRRLRTGRTVGLACETRKRRRVAGALARGLGTRGRGQARCGAVVG